MHVSSLFDDYVKFHRIQMANRDVDPVYPVLAEIADMRGWGIEKRVLAVFLHVAYYDLGSCLAAIDGQRRDPFLTAFTVPVAGLKCGTERRRHRMGDNLRVHLWNLHQIGVRNNGLSRWIEEIISDDPVNSWICMMTRLQEVEGNGRWAAYKTCEMLAEVCGYPLAAPDMGHAGSTGPRQGLALLYPEARVQGNRADVIELLDGISDRLVTELRGRGTPATLATAETTLCDFHSLVEGRYYPGLDIDVMQEQIESAPLSAEMRADIMKARKASLPHAYLGELGGWQGTDRKRKRVYRATGEIVER